MVTYGQTQIGGIEERQAKSDEERPDSVSTIARAETRKRKATCVCDVCAICVGVGVFD